MAQIPADAQRSDDGQWWGTGRSGNPSAIRPAPPPRAPSSRRRATPGRHPRRRAELSDDGQWQWDGTQWQPVQGAASGAASGAEAGASAGAAGASSDAATGASSGAAAGAGPLDPAEFPTLAALSQSNPNDFDSYLQMIGIDPSTLEEAVS